MIQSSGRGMTCILHSAFLVLGFGVIFADASSRHFRIWRALESSVCTVG